VATAAMLFVYFAVIIYMHFLHDSDPTMVTFLTKKLIEHKLSRKILRYYGQQNVQNMYTNIYVTHREEQCCCLFDELNNI